MRHNIFTEQWRYVCKKTMIHQVKATLWKELSKGWKIIGNKQGEQGMWWERSPPTNVARVQIPPSTHMWVKFVVGSLLCSERFFSGYSGFPLSSKTNIFKFQFDQESGRQRTTLWMCYLLIIIYLISLFNTYAQSANLSIINFTS